MYCTIYLTYIHFELENFARSHPTDLCAMASKVLPFSGQSSIITFVICFLLNIIILYLPKCIINREEKYTQNVHQTVGEMKSQTEKMKIKISWIFNFVFFFIFLTFLFMENFLSFTHQIKSAYEAKKKKTKYEYECVSFSFSKSQ